MTKPTPSPEALALKPCAHCGIDDAFVERADFSSCYVVCNNCLARGPVSCDETDEDADATESGACEPGELPARRLWNQRTRPTPTDSGEVVQADRDLARTICSRVETTLGHQYYDTGIAPLLRDHRLSGK